MTLADLIARVESAKGPDRELDRDILIAVRGMRETVPGEYDLDGWTHTTEGDERVPAFPSPTASLDAARSLVPEGWFWTVSERATPLGPGTGEGHVHNGRWHMSGHYRGADVFGHTPALALCAAALLVRVAEICAPSQKDACLLRRDAG